MKDGTTGITAKVLETLIIDPRYSGPPNVANGGYVCGLLAKYIDGPADIWIRRPTPLGKALTLVERDEGGFALLAEDQVMVEGGPGELDLDMPESPGFDAAVEAAKSSRALQLNTFSQRTHRGLHPTCFCCGADREDDHGLRIHPGRVPGKDLIAAPWIPAEELGDDAGRVLPEFLWTALDCPGAFAALEIGGGRPGLLGRLIGRILGSVSVGEPCVIVGRMISSEGRKQLAGTAVYNAKGELAGKALATWISRV